VAEGAAPAVAAERAVLQFKLLCLSMLVVSIIAQHMPRCALTARLCDKVANARAVPSRLAASTTAAPSLLLLLQAPPPRHHCCCCCCCRTSACRAIPTALTNIGDQSYHCIQPKLLIDYWYPDRIVHDFAEQHHMRQSALLSWCKLINLCCCLLLPGT
jgi:hypothetical protein